MILKEYEVVSGQQINFEKSSIQFGHKIEEPGWQELHDILGIHDITQITLNNRFNCST